MKPVTPAMRQYLEVKAANKDSIIFFRMGDFYEMFYEDAVTASKALGIALTSRDRDKEVPMCGVPYHAASTYIARLVREGHKVAVCEQVTDPKEAKGIIERAVVKVITPGVALEDELLDPRANNFIASAFLNSKRCGFSYMDVSTGEFRVTEVDGESSLHDEVKRIKPLELVVEEGLEAALKSNDLSVKKVTTLPKYDFDYKVASERLNHHFGTVSLDGFGLKDLSEGTRAAGALLHYIKETQRSDITHVRRCASYQTGDFLVLDPSTRRNLDIFENSRTGEREGSLIEALDRTRTAMGARRLKSWLLYPLKDMIEIRARQGAIEELIEKRELRVHIQEILSEVYDLERLSVKVSLRAANPRDLVSLKLSLRKIPGLKRMLRLFDSSILSSMASTLDGAEEAAGLIEASIVERPPVSVKDGGVIKEGYSAPLDELRETGSGGKDWIARLEAGERERTGINSLKVGYNRIFGYYIEVTKTNLASVPEDYIRKQTLVNAERFVTPALKEWEEKILTAEERALKLESGLFSDIVDEVSKSSERIAGTAASLSILDTLASLAQVSHERNYSKPSVNNDDALEIEGGRHPVIETKSPEEFVSNDLRLDPNEQIIVLTGPNMAGKSTYLRQNALIVLMAQIGSFVPATRANVGVVDRIFTRVGASDDLSRGQSTFMVEMSETANILNNATSRSLVILDEIGRGTSTFDGVSIAWGVVEFLHDGGIRPKTVFATHYHELTELSLTKERVKNYNMAVKEWNDKIIFLRKVVPGGTNRSYGIQVARLAGIPAALIERAKEILKNLESGELNDSGMPRLAARRQQMTDSRQLSLLGERDPIREELRHLDVNSITPIDALTRLQRLKEMLDN